MDQKRSISIILLLVILFVVVIISVIGWQRHSNRGVSNLVSPIPPSPATLEAMEAGLMAALDGCENYGEKISLTSGAIRQLPDDTCIEFRASLVHCPMDIYCSVEPYFVLRTKKDMRLLLGGKTGRVRPAFDDLQTINLEEFENMRDEHFTFLSEHPIDLIALQEHNAHIEDIRAGRNALEEAKKRQAERRSQSQ